MAGYGLTFEVLDAAGCFEPLPGAGVQFLCLFRFREHYKT